MIPNPADWQVTPETARLLQHWRHYEFNGVKPFFCQIEAVETAIWLTEVAPQAGKNGARFLDHLRNANAEANPELFRLALKLATGAGKTTVMAMLIAWQTVNFARRPASNKFTRGFLIVAPGLTIKDRLRVLQPGDPDSYYQTREIVPQDMLSDVKRAKIVITNYHAFKLRERVELSKGGRALLQGRGEALNTLETEGQMLQRVMPDLMGLKNVLVLNDEAHHCYREKPGEVEELSGDELPLAERVPIGGVIAGARQVRWHPAEPGSLVWVQALDGGNPKERVPHRDQLMYYRPPTRIAPVPLTQTEHRLTALQFFGKGKGFLVTDYDRDRRWQRTFLVNEGAPRLLFSRNIQDRYKDPGLPVMKAVDGEIQEGGGRCS